MVIFRFRCNNADAQPNCTRLPKLIESGPPADLTFPFNPPVKREMITSPAGQAYIKSKEGGPFLTPYASVEGGSRTIGYGHKITKGEDFGNGITTAKAESMFQADLEPRQQEVSRRVTATLEQNQFNALVSLRFNLSKKGWNGTRVPELLNTGKVDQALRDWSDLDHVNGKFNHGLEVRRSEQIRMFTGQSPTN